MIAKLEGTLSNELQNKDQTQSHNKQWEEHETKNQQQQNHRLRTDSKLSHRGDLNAFNWRQIFALIY